MNPIKHIFITLLIIVSGLFFKSFECYAADIIIEDNADLLTDEEEQELYKTMEYLADYGGVAFVTNPDDHPIKDASDYASSLCHDFFNNESGTVLLIDMCNRRIQIFSTGYIYKKISKQRADIITTNTYEYATEGNYFTCANESFYQMLIVLEGGQVSTPLKYLANLLLAFGISIMSLFLIVFLQRNSNHNINNDNIQDDLLHSASKNIKITKKVLTSKTKSRHSSSSGGHSGGGGGGHSGGGGGGGHSF